jgi:hypothetical protein
MEKRLAEMDKVFLQEKNLKVLELKQEYENLGMQLKELTREKIAEKFLIQPYAVTAIFNLDSDDLALITELVKERNKMLARRKVLRKTNCV